MVAVEEVEAVEDWISRRCWGALGWEEEVAEGAIIEDCHRRRAPALVRWISRLSWEPHLPPPPPPSLLGHRRRRPSTPHHLGRWNGTE
jgi:hypothetical protein